MNVSRLSHVILYLNRLGGVAASSTQNLLYYKGEYNLISDKYQWQHVAHIH